MNSFSFIDKNDFDRKLVILGELYKDKNIENILAKKIAEAKDFNDGILIDLIWNVCEEVHKEQLDLKDLKLFSNTVDLIETNLEFGKIMKEHVIISTQVTISNMLSKEVKLPLDCYDENWKVSVCGEGNPLCEFCVYSNFLRKYDESYCKQTEENKQTILDELIVKFYNGVNKFIKDTSYQNDEIPPDWLENVLDLCSFKNNKSVQSCVVDLLIYVVSNWKLASNITLGDTVNYNDIIKFINSLEPFIIHNPDIVQIYFMERCLNISFISELLLLAEHFQRADIILKRNRVHSDEPQYIKNKKIAGLKNKIVINVNNFNNYISKEDSGPEWKYLKRQFKNPLENGLNVDDLKDLDMPSDVMMSKEDFEKIFQGLSKFCLLPNSFSRNKFIYYAINSYYSRKSANYDLPAYALENWQEDISDCAEKVTNSIIPNLESCFFYTLCIYLKKFKGEKQLIKNMEMANQIIDYYLEKNQPDLFSGLLLYDQIHNESKEKTKYYYSNIKDCNNILKIIMPNIRSYMFTDMLKLPQYFVELRCSKKDPFKKRIEPGFRTKRKLKKSDYFFS